METIVRTKRVTPDNLVMLRDKVATLALQTEDEALLADVVAMLNGVKRPCTYTKEEFAEVLKEADEDFNAGRYISHEEMFARYGL